MPDAPLGVDIEREYIIMKSLRLTHASLLPALLCLSVVMAPVHADELKIGVATQMQKQKSAHSGKLPEPGLAQDSVQREFGEPVRVRGPVGDPAITIWEYPGYSVFFENNTVIHTVLKSG
ncbi:hypothetical protein GCM10022278_06950 [Allohahella marinimesophila]|uniref:Nickel/cobalt transporter regulator n=1 Tax=Allohahella marinimesophila TaxID=1054972 RepID=A0ABP7NN00_9GAMM